MIAIAIPVGLLIGLALGALGGGGSLPSPLSSFCSTSRRMRRPLGRCLSSGSPRSPGWLRTGPPAASAQGIIFGVLGIAGSYLGTWLSANVDPHVLLTAFAVLMLVADGAMLHRRRKRNDNDRNAAAPRAYTDDPIGGGRRAALDETQPPSLSPFSVGPAPR